MHGRCVAQIFDPEVRREVLRGRADRRTYDAIDLMRTEACVVDRIRRRLKHQLKFVLVGAARELAFADTYDASLVLHSVHNSTLRFTHEMVHPPSTTNGAPVANEPSSLARNSAIRAISSGFPILLST